MSEPGSEKRRRRRFGVSLRVMMLVVVAVGCLLAWRVRRAETQQRAVAQAEKRGFRVQYDYQYSGGRATPKGKPWAPACLRKSIGEEYFREVTSVACPSYGRSTIDADLAALEPFDRLEACRINSDNLTDAGLANLAGLTRLETLALPRADITDAGLAHLSRLSALKTLDLSRTRITDAGLAHLKGLPRLRKLDLQVTVVSDEAVDAMREAIAGLAITHRTPLQILAERVRLQREAAASPR